MNCVLPSSRVVIIGAGMAGAACARALAQAGCAVQVVDKARGVGGRLATRRLEWLDAQGHRQRARLDHGAPVMSACGAEFRQFLARMGQEGLVTPWWPVWAAGSRPPDDVGPLHLPREDMPSLCRWLLRGIPISLGVVVDRLQHGPLGWQVEASGSALPGHFDAVVLALPPAQAAVLLAPHRVDWAQRASLALMQPCWTLMGVARPPAKPLDWNVARPERGPLSWIMRNDARPGREHATDAAHWVVHARAGWSRQHLEQPADWVQDRLQSALQDRLGEPVEWQHAVVHRWRYALPQGSCATPARQAWWDGRRGLGVCGDFLGGTSVEGAWLSAQALGDAMVRGVASASAAPATPTVARPPRHIAA